MHIDWTELFAFHMSPLELFVRGSIIYWFLLLVFRFLMRRDMGSMAISDILLLVIIADASQNAMAGEYKTVSEGLVLLSTILGWNLLLNWLSWKFPMLSRLVAPPALALIKDGRIMHRNLRSQFVSIEELMSKLREEGVEEVAQVKYAALEPDGEVSVIKTKSD
jgi:uncharacterized membrane protein YcaP (DUF421 family)